MHHELETKGYTIVRGLLDGGEVLALREALGAAEGAGRRGMLEHAAVRQFAASAAVIEAVRPCLPGVPRAVRAIYFDKTPHTNWLVPWHQDLSIAVTGQCEAPGFGPWSTKDGVIHVQPPAEVLENMITLRLHLDDTDESNGALRLLPGSHRHGRLSAEDIGRLRAELQEETCSAAHGDALLMRPLILHASGRSVSQGHRRILHIEYAGSDLPHGLQWNYSA